MEHTFLGLSATALAAICVGIATVTDLRRRRIPNWLTFPAMAAGLGVWAGFLGWKGLALSAAGMIAAPVLIVVLHLGRTPGMGDIKLACGVGALLGPRLSLPAMLLAAAAGGIVALCGQLRAGTPIANTVSVFFVGVPGLARWARANVATDATPTAATMPYAVAIAAGVLMALAVFWCTGDEGWLL